MRQKPEAAFARVARTDADDEFRARHFQRTMSACGDTVAKVESRTTPKISRKLIFKLLFRCHVLLRGRRGDRKPRRSPLRRNRVAIVRCPRRRSYGKWRIFRRSFRPPLALPSRSTLVTSPSSRIESQQRAGQALHPERLSFYRRAQ
jgi:hypothetical protein